MEEKAVPKYLLVEAAVLPEVFVKVTQVKELLDHSVKIHPHIPL